MGDPRGFLTVKREGAGYRPVCERVLDYAEVAVPRPEKASERQGSRCMDCGTPFCHWACPVANYIPEWNDLLCHGHWERAAELLMGTNCMPEVTGRICPALCEYACVLGINDEPVTIRENELAVIEHAYAHGHCRPRPPRRRSGKRVAVVGSGPAGLSAAHYLNRAGHRVTVFERDETIGGILRLGIPDFKLDKKILDRRIALWKKEGIVFKTNTEIGNDMTGAELLKRFDAVCLAAGSRVPRDLPIEGRDLAGIHFAMDYLMQSNRRVAGRKAIPGDLIDAKGRRVLVIGGGDTGADCVGTANRQGASCVVQIEVLPQPPASRPSAQPWPRYPAILKTSSSHEEGAERHWSIMTKRFVGKKGRVAGVQVVRSDAPDKPFDIEADLVILAIGFLHPEGKGAVSELRLELDKRGNVRTDDSYRTSHARVYAAGDMRRGQSLVVWALDEGRGAARTISADLS